MLTISCLYNQDLMFLNLFSSLFCLKVFCRSCTFVVKGIDNHIDFQIAISFLL